MFLTIRMKKFFEPKLIWEQPLNDFFEHKKKFSHIIGLVIFGRTDKKKFGTIKELPVWFFANKEIFVSQNSYEHTSV